LERNNRGFKREASGTPVPINISEKKWYAVFLDCRDDSESSHQNFSFLIHRTHIFSFFKLFSQNLIDG